MNDACLELLLVLSRDGLPNVTGKRALEKQDKALRELRKVGYVQGRKTALEITSAGREALKNLRQSFPKKPTAASWRKDALALLAMGAVSIDARTVRGVLDETMQMVAAARRVVDTATDNLSLLLSESNLNSGEYDIADGVQESLLDLSTELETFENDAK